MCRPKTDGSDIFGYYSTEIDISMKTNKRWQETMWLKGFQIKPCHRRWSSILNPYVDRRDKLKWIIIKRMRQERKRVKTYRKKQSRSPWASVKLVRSMVSVRDLISVEYWMDIVAMLRFVNWSGMTVCRLRQQADLDICLSFMSFHHVRSGREGDKVHIHPLVKSRELLEVHVEKYLASKNH